MKKATSALLCMLILPLAAFATWQVANPHYAASSYRAVTPELGKTNYPSQFTVHHLYQANVYKGTLLDNITRIATQYGWAVLWNCYPKHHALINTKIAGDDFSTMLNQLISHYPIQVRYFEEHRGLIVDACERTKYYK